MSIEEQIKGLTQVLLSDSLKKKQIDFCRAKCSIFEDTEENKLEQTPIQNEQVALCDQLIDEESVKMGLKLDLELISKELTSRPCAFKDNHVIDTLFSIIDFNKFKELMCAFQKDNLTATNAVSNSVADFKAFREDLMEDSLNLLVNDLDSKAWKVTVETETRTVFSLDDKSMLTTQLKTFKDFKELRKVKAVFKGVKQDKVTSFIGDFGNWVTSDVLKAQGGMLSQMNSFREVKKIDSSTNIIAFRNDLPVVSGRDFLLQNTWRDIQYKGKTCLNFVVKSVELPECPEDPNQVRANMFRTGLLEKVDDDTVLLTAIVHMDMRGWFPSYLQKWIMSSIVQKNMDQMDILLKTLSTQ